MSLVVGLPCTDDVGLPTLFRFNVGTASQPIAGSMPTNRLRRWHQHYSNTGSVVYLGARVPANTCHSPNTVSILAERIRRWPAIETALGDRGDKRDRSKN